MKLITTTLALCLGFVLVGQEAGRSVKCLFVGDMMQHGGQIEGAYNKKHDTYDYRDCFQFIKPLVKQADIAIANLEVTHAGKPYKGYPQFSAPPQYSEAIVDAGFNVIITANNHSCDGGGKGVIKTLDALDALGVKHTGTFRNKAERDANYPLLIEKNDMRVVVLNYTYGTNGLSVAKPLIINYIDSAMMLADFKKARDMKPDAIICTMHWGTEYQSLPNTYQKKWEEFCYDQGATMVIGGHPHVLQPVEAKTINGQPKLTAWSLGNFVSNQRDRYKDGGMILQAELAKSNGQTTIENVTHTFTWVYPRQESVVKPFYILPDFNYNQFRTDFQSPEVLEKAKIFYEDSRKLFAEHSKGTTEYKVSDSATTQMYRMLLQGYYAFEYPGLNYEKWKGQVTATFKGTYHKVLGADGNYHWVFGYFDNPTKLEKAVVIEAELEQPRLIFITPTGYQIIE